MASPFRHFRKHSKTFFAVASVLAIGLFVFGSGTGGGGGGSRDQQRAASATVATWNSGSIREGELGALVHNRLITDQFLRMLFNQGGGTSQYDLPMNVPTLLLQSDRSDAVELEAINTEVFSSLASEAGMTVSDEMINRYLQEFGLRRVDSDQIRGILGKVGGGDVRSNEAVVFSTLRKMLLAYFYRRAYEDAGAVVMPQQRWDDWRRVNERISLQVAALPVEKFLDQVPEPTEAQLRTLYDQYKDADPGLFVSIGGRELPSPNPGFAAPRRVKLQYLVGAVADRTTKLLGSVTEEEVKDYYERNKRLEFTKTDDELDFGNEEPPAEGAVGATGDAADTDQPAAEAPAEGAPSDTAPATDSDATEGASPAPSDSEPASEAEPATDAAQDATTEPAVPASPGDAAAPAAGGESEPAPTTNDQSLRARRSPFRLTAALQAPAADDPTTAPTEGDETAADATTETDAAAADAASGDQATPTTPPAPAATDAVDAAGDAPAGTPGLPASPAEGAAAPSADAKPTDPAATTPAVDAAPVEYVPLDEVREQIRETLAREKAVTELEQQIGEATAKLQSEYNQYGRRVVEAREAKRKLPAPPPKLASLKWLADDYGLELQTTAALTVRELFETAVGKAADDQSGRISVTQAVFSSLELFEPFLAKELDGNWYLVTKTEDIARRFPSFEEVRDQVAAAWKRIEAAKLAETRAKELAEASQTATESFEQFFKDKGFDVVPQTALFSWRNYPLGPGMGYPAELSDVPELKNVGQDFMEAAFGLKDGKSAGLLNHDHSVAYVIRLHSRQYTPEELKKLFLAEDNAWPGRIDMMRERQSSYSQIVNRRIWEDLANFKFDEEWEKRRAERQAERN